jgi:endoglucanase
VADQSIIVNPDLVRFLEEAADAVNIPWQHRLPLSGGTDAGAIQLSRGGVLAGVISVPCRYIHSPSGILDLRDLEHTVTLLLEVIRRAPELRKLKR